VSMAVVMSEMPDVWRRVLAEHVPDGQQYCRACLHDGGRASWPCQTYRIAQEAKWVAEGGLPGTGPHGPGPSRTRLSPPEPTHAGDPLGTPERSYPASGGWSRPSTASGPISPTYDDRPFAGDPLASSPMPAVPSAPPTPPMPSAPDGRAATGERPYGSTFDAPYGASFGVDDRPHASRW
jgi:hypothetical protein